MLNTSQDIDQESFVRYQNYNENSIYLIVSVKQELR